ncbi:beta-N-acetylhexosaminidase [uncultured Lutibacter sp.]|uniref:beta-N-acetylhexosaminidase n=1 Tax=uncultured Lutibacter sp. TaxID=437739 RepID=UPI00261C2A1E|nr:beta-N-acetylhexosaminidase [uncultured Lutibacter sp.]
MKIKVVLLILTFWLPTMAQQTEFHIIPKPNQIEIFNGFFEIHKNTQIVASEATLETAKQFQSFIFNRYHLKLAIGNTQQKNKNNIVLKLANNLAKEAYQLSITKNQILITGGSLTGIFYGFQTIQQFLLQQQTIELPIKLPVLKIEDAPKFGWRAYMLDESRYFHGKDFVKLILDEMALLKMNIFHWHLTDDAGWRIEIKKYPKLTEIGATRADSEIETWGSGKTSGKTHSGYYTQEEIKEIVAYAAAKHITIVPEFEMPGHSSAAIAAYPWLGTLGKKIEVPVKFGRHYDNYDVTKPKVQQFIKNVLNELFELFPSEVIHIGGDEVGYKVWEEAEHVQKYMKEKGLKTPADLQIYFTNNISKFIESKGRRMMGWNEIMGKNIHKGFEEKKHDKEAETSLAQNVVVHFWKGNLELATEAAEKGYGIVNSLHSNTYLDYSYKSISLQKAYNFNPIPEGLEEKYHKNIYGLGCQMWSEWTPTNNDVAYQTFPRIAAFAEVGWTNTTAKNFETFKQALKLLQQHWKNKGINYANKL